MPELAEIVESALRLKIEERAALAQTLLTSLDELSPEESERIWMEEATMRLEDHRAGRAGASPSPEIAKKVAARFR